MNKSKYRDVYVCNNPARQSLKIMKIMVSYGNKYPRHNARPHVVKQSGQCAPALKVFSITVIKYDQNYI